MKDTFVNSDLAQKINHFIFECEVFDDNEKITQSRDIHVEIADYEFVSKNSIS
jgi:hypothetical protein